LIFEGTEIYFNLINQELSQDCSAKLAAAQPDLQAGRSKLDFYEKVAYQIVVVSQQTHDPKLADLLARQQIKVNITAPINTPPITTTPLITPSPSPAPVTPSH
jgi:hypothetical protein